MYQHATCSYATYKGGSCIEIRQSRISRAAGTTDQHHVTHHVDHELVLCALGPACSRNLPVDIATVHRFLLAREGVRSVHRAEEKEESTLQRPTWTRPAYSKIDKQTSYNPVEI